MTSILTELRRRIEGEEPGEPADRPYADGGVRGAPPDGPAGEEETFSDRLLGALPLDVGGTDPDGGRDTRVFPTEVEPDALLDEGGAFSEEAFLAVTGYTTTEFVVEYVERNGGGIRQVQLVDALPWSPSKVSRLLATLERESLVVRHPVGREKAVFLPDSAPAEAE